ncbi:MAG: hypothetical protein L6R19_25165 [Alphaproteobacteria bacterium]|nr:hypothetical protein [Alphaproteobacteria bacterium]
MSTSVFAAGGYRYIPAVFQYSGGVAAEPGHRIERVRFRQPVPLAEGFRRIAAIITGAGRPLAAFCACELRSPAPFTEAGFIAFNQVYVGTLADWGVYDPYDHLADEIVRRGAAEHGLTWHFCRPPVDVLDYEMDLRGVPVERVVT